MEPWISVIVPVYNVENYIDKCVQSLTGQTFSSLEIILVDDGSGDASGKLCDEFARRYPNVMAVHKENGGLASARNEGMKYARGEYVAFVDSDDWVDPKTYGVLYRKSLDEQPDILNFGYRKVCDGRILCQEHAAFPEGIYDLQQIREKILPDSVARETAFDQINLPVQLSACMCIYRREFLMAHGLCFESERTVLNEDWLFNIRCLCCAQSIRILHDIFYNYVTRETSLSWSYKPDAYERRKVLYARYREEMERSGLLNGRMERRLRIFWMESVYCCYLIEINAPCWDKNVRSRLNRLCRDPEFHETYRMLGQKGCTLKGHLFRIVMLLRLHGLMRLACSLKRKLERKHNR